MFLNTIPILDSFKYKSNMKQKNIVYVTATICILIGFTMKLLTIPHANILIYP